MANGRSRVGILGFVCAAFIAAKLSSCTPLQRTAVSEIPHTRLDPVVEVSSPVIAAFDKVSLEAAAGPDISKKDLLLTHRSKRVGDDLSVELKLWNLSGESKKVLKPSTQFYRFTFVALSGDQTVPYGMQPPTGLKEVVACGPGPTEEDYITLPVSAYVGCQFLLPGFYARAKNFPIRLQVLSEYGNSEIAELPR